MNLLLKIMSAFFLSMTLMFSGEAAFAKTKKKAKSHAGMSIKKKRAHASKKGKKSASYSHASKYMKNRKVASVKQHGKKSKFKASKSKAKKKKHKYYSS